MKPYELQGGSGSLFQPSIAQRLIENMKGERATKTWISSERSAILLGLFLSHARSVVRRVMLMHNAKNPGKPLTWDGTVATYPGCKKWMDTHNDLVEHFASIEGFAVQATVKLAQSQLLEEKRQAESSILPQKAGAKPA